MLSSIRTKIRALVADFALTMIDTFTYSTSNIFTLTEENDISITGMTINGAANLDYSYSSVTNEVTITASGLAMNDVIIIKYTYKNYSDVELNEYIRASLVFISMHSKHGNDFELETDMIYPVPTNQEQDLIALIGSILINPNYSEYRLPSVTVRYPRTMTKEKRIQETIFRFRKSIGILEVLEII